MEVFTLCDNITKSYVAHYNQKQIAVAIRKKTSSVNEPSKLNTDGSASAMCEQAVMSQQLYGASTFVALHKILSRAVSGVK